jgi:hypothetical protein
MDEFNKMLKDNKNMDKDQLGKFELRQVDRDSTGQERYIKTNEDEAITKNKIS